MNKNLFSRLFLILIVLCMVTGCSQTATSKNDENNVEPTIDVSNSIEPITQIDEENTNIFINDEKENNETSSDNKQEIAEEAQIKIDEQLAIEQAKLEEEKAKEIAIQKNSFSMMYYLAITSEEIRTSKNNRLILDDIYDALINDINPSTINEVTQRQMQYMRDKINSLNNISTKRERLQYIYNQNKAAAIRNAIPNPISILSTTNSLDWKKLAINVVYTAVSSYTSYKSSLESADNEFLTSGWELDDKELDTIQKLRDEAFNYMVTMVRENNLDGSLTLNEHAISNYTEICAIDNLYEKISKLESEENTYKLLGNYWLELADCYFQVDKYEKCLNCLDKYNELSIGIYRKDTNYAHILPKAIVAAQQFYKDNSDEYISKVSLFADEIIENSSNFDINTDWSIRYFVAEIYLDLYSKTNDSIYLDKAYNVAKTNVIFLLDSQKELNETYLNDIVEVEVSEPDYKNLSDSEVKEKKKEYKQEKKSAEKYNKKLKEDRKKELPSLYEPLILNCDLLFALANEKGISDEEKNNLDNLLGAKDNSIFLSKPINDLYSFYKTDSQFTIELSKDEMCIPADLLTANSYITISIEDDNIIQTFEDCTVTKVERTGETADTFIAHITSKQYKKYDWTENSKVKIKITYKDTNDLSITKKYHVSNFVKHWYGNKVEFIEDDEA